MSAAVKRPYLTESGLPQSAMSPAESARYIVGLEFALDVMEAFAGVTYAQALRAVSAGVKP